jgi:hypothetical protein
MANPNPPPPPEETRWKPGQSGNPGGFTAEQVEQRRRNRDRAIALEEKMLAALETDMTANEAAILGHIRADVLRLIHTAIERVDGKPKQAIDLESPEGSMSPPQIVRIEAVEGKSDAG